MAGAQEPDAPRSTAPWHGEGGDGAPRGLQLVLTGNGAPPSAAQDPEPPAERADGGGGGQGGGTAAVAGAGDPSSVYKRTWQTERAELEAELEAEQQQLRRHAAALAGSSDPAAQPHALSARIHKLQGRLDSLAPTWGARERQRELEVRRAEEIKAAEARKARLAEQERALAAMAATAAQAKQAEAEELARKRREAGLAGEDDSAEAHVASCVLGRGSDWPLPCCKAAAGCGIAGGERYASLRCTDGCHMALHHACWRELEKALRERHGAGWKLRAGGACITADCPGEICYAAVQQGPPRRAQELTVLVAPPERQAPPAPEPAKAGKGRQPREVKPAMGGRKPGAAPTRAELRMGAMQATQAPPADGSCAGTAAAGGQQGGRKARVREPTVDVTKLDLGQLRPVGKRGGEAEPPAKPERARKERKEARPPPVIGGQGGPLAERLPEDDLAPDADPGAMLRGAEWAAAQPLSAASREWQLEPGGDFPWPEGAGPPLSAAAGGGGAAPAPAAAEPQVAPPHAAEPEAAQQWAAAADPADEGAGVLLPARQRAAASRPAPHGQESRQQESRQPPASPRAPEQPASPQAPEQPAADAPGANEGDWASEDAAAELDGRHFLTGHTSPGEVGGGPLMVVEHIDAGKLQAAGVRPGEHLLDLATAFGTVTEFRFSAALGLACVRYECADRAEAAVGALHGSDLGGALIAARSLALDEGEALPNPGPDFWDFTVADVCTADSVDPFWAAAGAQPDGDAGSEGLPPLLAGLQAIEVVVCDEAGLAAYSDEGPAFGVLRSQLAGGGGCGQPTGVALLQEETGQLWGLWRLVAPLGEAAVAKLVHRYPPLSTADSARLLHGSGARHPVALPQPRARALLRLLLAAEEEAFSPEAAVDAVNAAVSRAEEDERLARQLQQELDFEAAAGMQGMVGQRPSYRSVTAQAPAAAMALAARQQQHAAAEEDLFWGMPGDVTPPAQKPQQQPEEQPEAAAAEQHPWQQEQPEAASQPHAWRQEQPLYQQPAAVQQQPLYQQPAAVQQQPLYQQPAAVQQQPLYQQPAAVQQQPLYQQPAAVQQQPLYQQPAAVQQQPLYQQPAPAQQGAAHPPQPLHHQPPQPQPQQQQCAQPQPAVQRQRSAGAAAAGPGQAADEAWREAFAAAKAAAAQPPPAAPAAEGQDEFLQDLLSLVLNS